MATGGGMYGWWSGYWQAWWQESLSQSYVASSQSRHSSENKTESANAATQRPAGTPSFPTDWPFETALCQLDENLEFAAITSNFSAVTGISAEQKPRDVLSLIKDDARQHFLFCLQQVLFSDDNSMHPMMRVRLAARPDRWLHISGRRCPGEGIQLCLRDITQEMHLERELVRARINAELAQRARSEFLGRMSHELRTPLNAVIGFAQMIDGKVGGPLNHEIYEEYVTSILQSGEQLREKINNLLALSEAELGEIELQEDIVPLVTLLRSASEHHQHFAFSKDIQLSLDVNVWSAPHVRVDKGLMAKALSNLIENAIACTRPGGSVRIDCGVSSDGCVLIRVCDTGIGLTDALLRNLADFFAGSYSSNNYYERIPLGTGLMLTREYVQMHGGRLEVSSEKGNGAVFTICLPPQRRLSRQATGSRTVALVEALAI